MSVLNDDDLLRVTADPRPGPSDLAISLFFLALVVLALVGAVLL